MTARDELAKLLFMADNSAAKDPEAEWREVQEVYPHGTVYAYNLADAILADGYGKPRVITAVEELIALPHGSVIRSEHRHYWVAHKEDGMGDDQGWAAAGSGAMTSRELQTWLPATVLHEPGDGS